MKNTEIQFAKPTDIPQIVSFGYKSYDENFLNQFKQSPDFNKTLLQVTDWVNNHVVLVKRNGKNPALLEGVFAMTYDSTWWSTDKILFAPLFYILPEKRSFKVARDLLKTAQEYAIMNQIPIVLDLVSLSDTRKKAKLLKYLGFKDLGSSFIFVPKE